ncbi:hypothetical protein EB796_016549 [Bugula neritina]|uniref:Uncharacterized protein n=1 Tax=Bugula neritina TaxID=10212 RepID=A0A7J7JFT4_BUGNE|nr:hypothetical protein EB796_016549 [Bugula neritina]
MSMNVRIRMVVVPINVPMTGALIIVNAHQDMNLTSTTEHVLTRMMIQLLEDEECKNLPGIYGKYHCILKYPAGSIQYY